MPGKLRVFISHSAKDDNAREFLCDMKKALEDAHHQVLLDRTGLGVGVDWRSTLNMWMGGCDAAVVVLSEDALTSNFMVYETSILSYRKDSGRPFELLPVVLRPVTYERVKSSNLSPTMLPRWNAAIKDSDGAAAIAGVLQALAAFRPIESPLDQPARQVRSLLQRARVPDFQMQAHLEHLGVDVPPWVPGDDLAAQLAMSMVGAGLAASVQFIRRIRSLMERAEVEDLIKLLGCSWVDLKSVDRIPRAAREQRAISLNARDPLTVRMYVIRSALEDQMLLPRDSWKVADVAALITPPDDDTEAAGFTVADALRPQILARLAEEFDADEDEVLAEIAVKKANEEPVFVALPIDGLTRRTLLELRAAFDGVAFFLLAGADPPAPELDELALRLEPELEAGSEERFRRIYDEKRTYLLQGLAA